MHFHLFYGKKAFENYPNETWHWTIEMEEIVPGEPALARYGELSVMEEGSLYSNEKVTLEPGEEYVVDWFKLPEGLLQKGYYTGNKRYAGIRHLNVKGNLSSIEFTGTLDIDKVGKGFLIKPRDIVTIKNNGTKTEEYSIGIFYDYYKPVSFKIEDVNETVKSLTFELSEDQCNRVINVYYPGYKIIDIQLNGTSYKDYTPVWVSKLMSKTPTKIYAFYTTFECSPIKTKDLYSITILFQAIPEPQQTEQESTQQETIQGEQTEQQAEEQPQPETSKETKTEEPKTQEEPEQPEEKLEENWWLLPVAAVIAVAVIALIIVFKKHPS